MSNSVLPTIPGLTYPASRSSLFNTGRQDSISGKSTTVARWAAPRYKWTLDFSVLRQGSFSGSSYSEFATLQGFFEQLLGGFDTFLYQDPNDNAVTGQGFASGDGSTTTFQLQRTFGSAIMPILAPDTGSTINIYKAGTLQTTGVTVGAWGSASPGVVTFSAAPGSGAALTADFSYYFPCRFDADQMDFSLFMKALYSASKISFTSVK